jgi:hypothetical protein
MSLALTATQSTLSIGMILFVLICVILYAISKRLKRTPNVSIDTSKALWCLRNDPKVARAVLTLAYFEKMNDTPHINRRKSFLMLELRNRLRQHITDKDELRIACRQLVRVALDVSKLKGRKS